MAITLGKEDKVKKLLAVLSMIIRMLRVLRACT